MSAITAIRYPQIRLPDWESAPPCGTVAYDGWLARFFGEPRLADDLTVSDAGEWLEGYDAAHRSAVDDRRGLEIWVGSTDLLA